MSEATDDRESAESENKRECRYVATVAVAVAVYEPPAGTRFAGILAKEAPYRAAGAALGYGWETDDATGRKRLEDHLVRELRKSPVRPVSRAEARRLSGEAFDEVKRLIKEHVRVIENTAARIEGTENRDRRDSFDKASLIVREELARRRAESN